MSDMVSVPAETVRELSAEVYDYPAGFPDTPLLAAARAVVDAVEFEDEAGPIVITREELLSEVNAETAIAGLLAEHRWSKTTLIKGTYCTCGWNVEGATTEDREAHVASVIAAHMAAPDELTAAGRYASANEVLPAELTALRERVAELEARLLGVAQQVGRDTYIDLAEWVASYVEQARERDALRERLEDCRTSLNNHIRSEDALRERIRALADEWDRTPQGDIGSDRRCARQLRAALGDA